MKMAHRLPTVVEKSPLRPAVLDRIHSNSNQEVSWTPQQEAISVAPHHLPPLDRAVLAIEEPDLPLLLQIDQPTGSQGNRDHGCDQYEPPRGSDDQRRHR